MLVGYMRVSTSDERQSVDLQHDALLGAGVDDRHLHQDRASGARDDRPRVSVRPRHPRQDIEAQQAHKKTSPIWSPQSSPHTREQSLSNCGGKSEHASASTEA